MEDLERNPETSFEMDVIYEDEEEFCLSIDNMAALKLFLSQVILCNICCYVCVLLTGGSVLNIYPIIMDVFFMPPSSYKNTRLRMSGVVQLSVLRSMSCGKDF